MDFRRVLLQLTLILCAGSTLPAQDSADPAKKTAGPDLSGSQQQIFRDYDRFEKSLFDVAEQVRRKDPERAELLYRARSQSQEQNILDEMETISELLRTRDATGATASPQFGPAVDRQKELVARLEGMLRLLQSLDERERITAEITRLQELLKDTNRLIARQKDVRAETQRGKQNESSKEAQQRVAEEAERLQEKIRTQDQERGQPLNSGEKQPGAESSPEKGKSLEKSPDKNGEKNGEKNPQGGEKSDSESGGDQKQDKSSPQSREQGGAKPGQKSQGQQGQQNQGKDQQSGQSPSPGAQSEPQKDSQKTPGREQLEQARREMQQAIDELEKQNREKALDKQEEAVSRLEEMKAKLEEILRQLREDEKESYLTLLEARFQNMLKRQQQVNSETIRLDKVALADRAQQNWSVQADNTRKAQGDNALEADKALHLLREEGSSVAFPEAVQQMRDNMNVVVGRLSRQNTDQITQTVEAMIVSTLEEMITALRQELQKKQDQQQGQPGQPGQPQDPALVNQLAELRLIRSLQSQIHTLTKQIGTEVDNDGRVDPDQASLIRDLQRRQERIQEATYDLSVGRNK
jgi:hypothetical protein